MVEIIGGSLIALFIGFKVYQRLFAISSKTKGLVGHRKIAKLLLSKVKRIDLDPKDPST